MKTENAASSGILKKIRSLLLVSRRWRSTPKKRGWRFWGEARTTAKCRKLSLIPIRLVRTQCSLSNWNLRLTGRYRILLFFLSLCAAAITYHNAWLTTYCHFHPAGMESSINLRSSRLRKNKTNGWVFLFSPAFFLIFSSFLCVFNEKIIRIPRAHRERTKRNVKYQYLSDETGKMPWNFALQPKPV